MSAIDTLVEQHRACDARFAACETAARAQDWALALARFQAFRQDMEAHFAMEEDALFPAFEAASGSSMGPTRVMRMEHQDMRDLLADMDEALNAQHLQAFLGLNDTLLILMQQHNMKEENVLYPMCAQALPEMAELIAEGARP
ncbi:hemerythrin domain-containing protein [Chromobacterium alkanivorans]|uniref:hemerythrin domain-containing protein n=1 Tax=Chromobacterium alkanivorans TaxID=1071719 RepID=UPI001967A002|nr:hemerythrin domain-containing protein [Chromobacterium alkanivorans]MBN3002508.1 hemerythrin domain-containing protein [Chromobacterium alkanivorans]